MQLINMDLTECGIDENHNIQPIDLDEGIFDNNRDEWPWWTQERKNEEWTSPTDIQDTLSYSGYYVGENFDWDNALGTQRFMGHLPATPTNTWKEYKKFKKEQGK